MESTVKPTTRIEYGRVAVVVPCYRVREHILDVLQRIGPMVTLIYVVDDACPDNSGALVRDRVTDPRVRVLVHPLNQGVGGAVLTGVQAALNDGCTIVVKIDGDGQMDPGLLPLFVEPILAGAADLTKGNRFYNPEDVLKMPPLRLLGNVALSFLSKLSTGYWNIFDPTNGYIAVDARLLAVLPLSKVSRGYFFETDLLFRANLYQAKVLDIPMTAVYSTERSNLKIARVMPVFFMGHLTNFVKRLFYSYFLRDFNIGSLELISGILLITMGAVVGISNWSVHGQAATAGTVMLAALPVLTGIILLISFVNYDVQQIPREPISSRLGFPSGRFSKQGNRVVGRQGELR
jgi:dolichol-phosphate mannosyltransferase